MTEAMLVLALKHCTRQWILTRYSDLLLEKITNTLFKQPLTCGLKRMVAENSYGVCQHSAR